MDTKQESGRKPRKFKWSIVDTVLVLLLLVAVVGGALRVVLLERERSGQTGKDAMYAVYFEVEETHEDVLSSIEGFDVVYLLENDARLGQIAVYEDAESGTYRPSITPAPAEGAEGDRRVVAVGCFIATDVQDSDKGLLVGRTGVYLAPGTRLEVRTDRARMTIRITEILPHS